MQKLLKCPKLEQNKIILCWRSSSIRKVQKHDVNLTRQVRNLFKRTIGWSYKRNRDTSQQYYRRQPIINQQLTATFPIFSTFLSVKNSTSLYYLFLKRQLERLSVCRITQFLKGHAKHQQLHVKILTRAKLTEYFLLIVEFLTLLSLES